jgi:hypothetical protein
MSSKPIYLGVIGSTSSCTLRKSTMNHDLIMPQVLVVSGLHSCSNSLVFPIPRHSSFWLARLRPFSPPPRHTRPQSRLQTGRRRWPHHRSQNPVL